MIDLSEEFFTSFSHNNEALRKSIELIHQCPLIQIWSAEHGVQRRDHRHPQVAQQSQKMAAGRPAEDAKLVLNRDEFDIVGVKEMGRAAIGIDFLLVNLKPDPSWIVVTFGSIIDRAHQTSTEREFRCHRFAKVGGKGGDAAFARKMISQEGHLVEVGDYLLRLQFVGWETLRNPCSPQSVWIRLFPLRHNGCYSDLPPSLDLWFARACHLQSRNEFRRPCCFWVCHGVLKETNSHSGHSEFRHFHAVIPEHPLHAVQVCPVSREKAQREPEIHGTSNPKMYEILQPFAWTVSDGSRHDQGSGLSFCASGKIPRANFTSSILNNVIDREEP